MTGLSELVINSEPKTEWNRVKLLGLERDVTKHKFNESGGIISKEKIKLLNKNERHIISDDWSSTPKGTYKYRNKFFASFYHPNYMSDEGCHRR